MFVEDDYMYNNMKYLVTCFLFLSLLAFPVLLNGAESVDEAEEIEVEVEEDGIGPDPQRLYCVSYWNEYYKRMKKANIKVSSKGEFDEIIVFNCPDCSLEKHYVEPFLNTEIDGLTGLERIRECGFTQAVFKGSKGLREIVRVVN